MKTKFLKCLAMSLALVTVSSFGVACAGGDTSSSSPLDSSSISSVEETSSEYSSEEEISSVEDSSSEDNTPANMYPEESLQFQKIAGKEAYRVVGLGNVSDLDIVIPSTYRGLPVTEIGERAFWHEDGDDYATPFQNITSIVIPDSVQIIGDSAFEYCYNLTSVVIGDSVQIIGDYAFYRCDNLQYTIKDNLKYLGNATNPYLCLMDTTDASITSATIDNACRVIGPRAFSYCSNLTSIEIPDSVQSIGEYAFNYCSKLTSVTIPDRVQSIGEGAFYACDSLTSVIIPESVQYVGMCAFGQCDNLTIYCEADSEPNGWDSNWNMTGGESTMGDELPVVWGYKGE